ncbi:MAG: hypothetical protein KGI50_06065, partial [Patescibacteria group bacterium]|nr:hypothetical protein [Patescibacteria group bacterium]
YEQMNGNVSGFMREFPMTFEEAFQSAEGKLIDSVILNNAILSPTVPDLSQPKILGVDPAGDGDRTALVYRQGYYMNDYETFNHMDAQTLANIILDRIDRKQVDHVFIDMGYGHGTYDILRGKCHITGVHFGGRANNPMLYEDKRSEMAGEFKDWMSEGPDSMGGTARISSKKEFIDDIRVIPELEFTTKRKFKLAPKVEIKKELKRSPDLFDAGILTFAHPVRTRRHAMGTQGQFQQGERKSMLTTNQQFQDFQQADQAQTYKQNPNFQYYNYPKR